VDIPGAPELTSEADKFLKVNTLQGFPLLGLAAGMELWDSPEFSSGIHCKPAC
jgi:hypothetical protein